jgi:hypothetical protein
VLRNSRFIKERMNWNSPAIAFVAIGLVGCGIGRVVTAPVRYVFHEPESTSAPAASDVTNPGQPVVAPPPSPSVAGRTIVQRSKRTAASPIPSPRVAANKANTKSSTPGTGQFPVAKPVPGKPGLVFNPFKPNGGYIDVSGYAPGSKVKDPDSQQIFIVP